MRVKVLKRCMSDQQDTASATLTTEVTTITKAAGHKVLFIDYSALRPHKAITVDHVNRVLGVGTYTDEELKKTRDEWKVEKCDCRGWANQSIKR